MPKRIFFIVLLMLIQFSGMPQNAFEFTYSTTDDDFVLDSALDNDGNVVLVGHIGKVIEQTGDALIIKVFPDGSYQEKRFVRQDTVGVFSRINILDNGDYFVTGSYSAENNSESKDHLWILILTPEFEIIEDRFFMIPEGYIGFGVFAKFIN